jgi:hypothetical protein
LITVASKALFIIGNGDRDLTVEQALSLCEFFGFIELEADYFVSLVERERAGTHQLKK